MRLKKASAPPVSAAAAASASKSYVREGIPGVAKQLHQVVQALTNEQRGRVVTADIFTTFRKTDLVPLEHQGKHVLLNPDTFRVYKISADAAAVLSGIRSGVAPEI